MRSLFSDSRKEPKSTPMRKRKLSRELRALTKHITERPRLRLTRRTTIFLALRLPAFASLRNTRACQRSAAGASKPRLLQSDGSGLPPRKSGTDGMTTNGTTGAHPNLDSPLPAGPGIRATGIMQAMSTNSSTASGTDSRAANGSSTQSAFHSTLKLLENAQSADPSTSS